LSCQDHRAHRASEGLLVYRLEEAVPLGKSREIVRAGCARRAVDLPRGEGGDGAADDILGELAAQARAARRVSRRWNQDAVDEPEASDVPGRIVGLAARQIAD